MATAVNSRCEPNLQKVTGGPASKSRTTHALLKRLPSTLKPVTRHGSTAFSSVASVFEFHHHVGTDPTNELLVLKGILARECALSRLEVACHELRKEYRRPVGASGASGSPHDESTAQVIELLSQVRDATVEVVEAVVTWRKDVGKHPLEFIWRGENYLLKTTNDLNFLAGVEPLVAAMKMHPARFCRNPLMLPRTLDEQLKDGDRCDADCQDQSPRYKRRRYLYNIAKVLLDEEAKEAAPGIERRVTDAITKDPVGQQDDGRTTTIPTNVLARDSVVAHTRHRGYHHGITRANEKDIPDFLELSPISSNYFALLRTSIADTTPDGSRPQPPAFLERHAALPEKPEAEEYLADSNLEVRKTLQQDQLSTWYEEARLQLISLSSSPEDEKYFLSSRRFWSKDELGTMDAPAPSHQQLRRPGSLQRNSPRRDTASSSPGDPEGVDRRRGHQEIGVPTRYDSRRVRPPGDGADGMQHGGTHLVGRECPAFVIATPGRRRLLDGPYGRAKRKPAVKGSERASRVTGPGLVGSWDRDAGAKRIQGDDSLDMSRFCEPPMPRTQDTSGALAGVSPGDIERLLCETGPPPATSVVCAAVVFLLAPEDKIPEGFSWPQGFEAQARPADAFLQRLRDASSTAVSPSKAQALRSVLQTEDLLPVALEQRSGHTVASLCAWVLEELRGCDEFADWSRAALGSWYERPSLVKVDAARSRLQLPGPEIRQLHRSLRTLPNGQGSFVFTLFEELDGGRLLIRAFERAKRETFWLPLSRKQMDSLGENTAASPANLVAALARKMTLKVDNATGAERLVLPSLTGGSSTSKKKLLSSPKQDRRNDLTGSKPRRYKLADRNGEALRGNIEPTPAKNMSIRKLNHRTRARRCSSRLRMDPTNDNSGLGERSGQGSSVKDSGEVGGELTASGAGSAVDVTEAPTTSAAETRSNAFGREEEMSRVDDAGDNEAARSTIEGRPHQAQMHVDIASPTASLGMAEVEPAAGDEQLPPAKQSIPSDCESIVVIEDDDGPMSVAAGDMAAKSQDQRQGTDRPGDGAREVEPQVGQHDEEQGLGEARRLSREGTAEVQDESDEYNGDEFGDDDIEPRDTAEPDGPHSNSDYDVHGDSCKDVDGDDSQARATLSEAVQEKDSEKGLGGDVCSDSCLADLRGETSNDGIELATPMEMSDATIVATGNNGTTGPDVNESSKSRTNRNGGSPRAHRAGAVEENNSIEARYPSDFSMDTAADDFEEDFEEDPDDPNGAAAVLDVDSMGPSRERPVGSEVKDSGSGEQLITLSRDSTATDGSCATEGSYGGFDEESDNEAALAAGAEAETETNREPRPCERGRAEMLGDEVDDAEEEDDHVPRSKEVVARDSGNDHLAQAPASLDMSQKLKLKSNPVQDAPRERGDGRRASLRGRAEAEGVDEEFESDFEDDV